MSKIPAEKFSFAKNSFIIITGASRGLGEELLLYICSKIAHENCRIIITARDEDHLIKSCQKAFSILKQHIKGDVSNIIRTFGFDFADDYDIISKNSVQISQIFLESPIKFDQILIICNAATLGPIDKRADDFITPQDFFNLETYFRINVTSQILFNSVILKNLRSFLSDTQIFIVNISSLLAIKPFPGFSLYCSAKAARESYFKVLSVENDINVEKEIHCDPRYKKLFILNYSPGPLATDMLDENKGHFDANLKNYFDKLKNEGKLVPLEKTTEKLFSLLENGNYLSGNHKEYFDL